jgi:hypothetical protein
MLWLPRYSLISFVLGTFSISFMWAISDAVRFPLRPLRWWARCSRVWLLA